MKATLEFWGQRFGVILLTAVCSAIISMLQQIITAHSGAPLPPADPVAAAGFGSILGLAHISLINNQA